MFKQSDNQIEEDQVRYDLADASNLAASQYFNKDYRNKGNFDYLEFSPPAQLSQSRREQDYDDYRRKKNGGFEGSNTYVER